MSADNIHNIRDNNDNNAIELLFESIFKQYELRLYNLALKMTKSHQQACDIIQDVFLKLWEQRHTIHSINNIEAWLYRITENKVIDYLRKTAADRRLMEIVWNNLQKNAEETEAVVAAKEYNQIIIKAIDNLPPQRKLIYYLNKERGLNYKEIANELSISKHTVKNQLSTAVQSIRNFLNKSIGLLSLLF
ncbi:MAG: RNA polymerase sigma-70 factor [Chitinophagaceae bacterium]